MESNAAVVALRLPSGRGVNRRQWMWRLTRARC